MARRSLLLEKAFTLVAGAFNRGIPGTETRKGARRAEKNAESGKFGLAGGGENGENGNKNGLWQTATAGAAPLNRPPNQQKAHKSPVVSI